MGDLTKNFSKSEFDCKDGSEMPSNVLDNVYEQAENLQIIRDFFDSAVTINSAYRSPSHNASVGGAKNSQQTPTNTHNVYETVPIREKKSENLFKPHFRPLPAN